MAYVHVTTKNNAGQVAVLTLDDERDAERIEYLKKLAKREDLDSVSVKPAAKPAPKS